MIAAVLANDEAIFGGFLLNPIDGNTYLAKMYQGWSGSWHFRLAYSVEAREGVAPSIFLFYIFLGHVARVLGSPLLVVFHAARIAGGVAMLAALAGLYERVFAENQDGVVRATWLAAFGAGMGWLAVLSGIIPADFWVAEAYPFLSAYSNPHFPLALALFLSMLLLALDNRLPEAARLGALAVLGLLLSIVLPFAVVVLAVTLAGWFALEWMQSGKTFWREQGWKMVKVVAASLALGGPFLLYQYAVILNDPILAGWNAQNLTPAPALWDFVVSLSPALPLALVGAWQVWREPTPARRLVLAWFGLGVLLVYVPFALQRRFLFGLYIPTAALAVIGVQALLARWEQKRLRFLPGLLLWLSLPTNLFLLTGGLLAAAGHAPQIYLNHSEFQALAWIQVESHPTALVLASPETGNYIPAYTGRRVLYGHPFETLRAEEEEAAVKDFYSGKLSTDQMNAFLAARQIDLIVVGKREKALVGQGAAEPDWSGYPVLYQDGETSIYDAKLPSRANP